MPVPDRRGLLISLGSSLGRGTDKRHIPGTPVKSGMRTETSVMDRVTASRSTHVAVDLDGWANAPSTSSDASLCVQLRTASFEL